MNNHPMSPTDASHMLRDLHTQVRAMLLICIANVAMLAYDTATVYHLNQLVHAL